MVNTSRFNVQSLGIDSLSPIMRHCMPHNWTQAIVTPVFKRGDAANVDNYRPISLTSVACKIMERVTSTDMLHYLREHNVISKHQHGFLSGRSTSTNLLETLNDWTLAIKNKQSVVVAYIDYSKAFDCVTREKLLIKLSAYGIAGNLLKWIDSFLSNRTQRTRVGSSLSDIVNLTSGVVQGSVIGPLLFFYFSLTKFLIYFVAIVALVNCMPMTSNYIQPCF
jgi:hypothetical protein